MTTLAHRSALRGTRDGGVVGRRAVVRWAWRMFHREWRQQILVVSLLTVAVAAAIGSVAIAYNSGAADDDDHGSATHLLRYDGSDPQALQASLDSAREWFRTTEVIGYRSFAVPGSVETVEFRAQDPNGAFGSALLALRRGSYPEGPSQVAVTDGVADLLALEIGEPLALDGRRRSVVGIVENPRDLSDEFALVSPASAGAPDNVTVLVHADAASIDGFLRANGPLAQDGRSAWVGSEARPKDQSASALAMFSVATVFLLLASLVAAAGFAVVAQRRLRQLGMLAAIGAAQKHLRLVLLTNGAVVGAIGAAIGTVLGLGLWFAVLPTLETAFDHRIDPLSLPWALLAMVVFVAVLGATAAAWWPGRAVARVPVTLALSGRPPRPKAAHRSAIVAAVLIAAGMGSLAFADRSSPPLIVAGILATILGTLLLGPLAIRIFAKTAGHAPVAARLALRDLARYQARSGAALAAITLALGIAATVVVTAAAEEKRDKERAAAELPNLSDRQIRVYTGPTREPELIPLPIRTPAQLARSVARVRQLAGGLDGATVIPLRKALQPGDPPIVTSEGDRALVAVGLSKQTGPRSWTRESGLYVATPDLLRHLGIDPATVDPSADFLADPTVPTDELDILRIRTDEELAVTNVQRIESREVLGSGGADTGKVPSSFVTLNGLRRHGWKQIPAGWLVESSRPLTSEQIAAARDLAAEAGLTIETQRESTSFATPMAIVTAAGALLALAILAMTVGLIRSESASDLRTLTATGATSRVRRTLTAATAGALALLGALLGVAGAYVVLMATYHDDLGYLSDVPVLYLALIVVGVPLTAAAAGWLLAGREPPALARPVIE
jgi:putative ABC transport system permease protein